MRRILIVMFTVLIVFPNLPLLSAQEQTYVVYRDRRGALFSVSSLGGEVTRLTPEDTRVNRYEITSDGYVIFLDRLLFAVPVSGGTPRQLHDNPEGRDDVGPNFIVSSNQIIYEAENGLFSVPAAEGEPTQLNAVDQLVELFEVSPDGNFVIYTAANQRRVLNLYSVPISGGNPVQLNARLTSGGEVVGILINPTSTHVVYHADQDVDGVWETFSVPITGGDVVKLFPGSKFSRDFYQTAFSPDGNGIALLGHLPGEGQTNGTPIHYVPITGGGITTLGEGNELTFSPDGEYLFYNLRYHGFHQVSIDGQSDLIIATANVFVSFYLLSPDYQWLVYTGGEEIFRVRTSAFSEVGLIGTDIECGSQGVGGGRDFSVTWICSAAISPDSQYFVYVGNDESGVTQIYSVALDADIQTMPEAQHKLNKFSGSKRFSGEQMLRITADSSTVIYTNDEEAEGFMDIYSVPIDGSANSTRITPDDSIGVQDFKLHPHGTDWYKDFPFPI